MSVCPLSSKNQAEGRELPSCQSWQRHLEGGTPRLEGRWRSWGLLLHATPGRKREKLSPICGAEWVSCCSAAMLPYSGIGFQPYLEPLLTGSFNPKIHCLLSMINVCKSWNIYSHNQETSQKAQHGCWNSMINWYKRDYFEGQQLKLLQAVDYFKCDWRL